MHLLAVDIIQLLSPLLLLILVAQSGSLEAWVDVALYYEVIAK